MWRRVLQWGNISPTGFAVVKKAKNFIKFIARSPKLGRQARAAKRKYFALMGEGGKGEIFCLELVG